MAWVLVMFIYLKPKDKPLHGLQDAPLKTITAARDAMRAFDAAVA